MALDWDRNCHRVQDRYVPNRRLAGRRLQRLGLQHRLRREGQARIVGQADHRMEHPNLKLRPEDCLSHQGSLSQVYSLGLEGSMGPPESLHLKEYLGLKDSLDPTGCLDLEVFLDLTGSRGPEDCPGLEDFLHLEGFLATKDHVVPQDFLSLEHHMEMKGRQGKMNHKIQHQYFKRLQGQTIAPVQGNLGTTEDQNHWNKLRFRLSKLPMSLVLTV